MDSTSQSAWDVRRYFSSYNEDDSDSCGTDIDDISVSSTNDGHGTDIDEIYRQVQVIEEIAAQTPVKRRWRLWTISFFMASLIITPVTIVSIVISLTHGGTQGKIDEQLIINQQQFLPGDEITNLEYEISQLDPSVYFTAGLNSSTILASGAKLLFTHVIPEVGGGYNPSTGVFTCPSPGVYLFKIHALVQSGNVNKFHIRLVSHNETLVDLIGDETRPCTSNTAVQTLSTGEEVWLEAVDQSHIFGNSSLMTTFSAISRGGLGIRGSN